MKFLYILQNKNVKNGILYTVFSFINSGISFILLLILAKYLTPGDYGSLNLFTTFVTLVNIIISLCTVSYVSICFFQKSKEQLNQVIVIALVTTTIMLFILSSILLAMPNYIEQIIGIPSKYLWLGLLICYFQVYNALNLDIWRLEEKPVQYGLYGVSFAICNFILTFWLIVGLHFNWAGRVYAWTLLSIIYFIISVLFLFKRRYLSISKPQLSLVKETFIYALPLIPHTVSFWLKQGIDRYIINYFHNQTSVGFYSFALNLAAVITIIGTAFNSTNSVYIYKKLSNGSAAVRDGLNRQATLMSVAFLIISILVGFCAYTLIKLFMNSYDESIPYIIPLCLGSFFHCLYLLWVNYLFYYKKTQKLMFVTLSTALLQIIFSMILTRYSILYTAYTSMVVSFITLLLVYILSKKILNNEFEVK